MIRIGTYLVKGGELDAEEKLRITKDAGFDFICFGAKSLLTGNGPTPDMCARVGIGFDNVHLTSNGTHAIWAEGEDGEVITERYCREIAECSAPGIKTGIAHVTWGLPTPPPICERGLHRLERVAECAEKHGFTVALENSAYPEYLHYVLGNLKSGNIGYCFDSGHRNAFAPDEDFLARYGHMLAATHIQDNEGRSDLHMIPGDGSIDWNKVAGELAATALGRNRICSEVAGVIRKERPGRSAAEIRAELERVAVLDDGKLVKIYDGGFTIYEGLPYEAYIARLAAAMRRIAGMVADAARVSGK